MQNIFYICLHDNKKKIYELNHTFFITFTCYNWMPLFEATKLYDAIYKWMNLLTEKKCQVLGYVIMPNHIHLLIYIHEDAGSPDKLIGNAKRFLAYEIIYRLKEKTDISTLNILKNAVNFSDKKKGKIHEVFQPSFDIKICDSNKFVQQKLDYIHLNPVTKKWKLVDDYLIYEHSSVKFYELNLPCKIKIIHWQNAGEYI